MPTALPQITHHLAERHEALWLRLSALHKDVCAIATKKPEAPVGNTERATVEGLISDCRPFLKKPADRLPVAAQHFAGLALQLGQVLAMLEDFENRHAFWDGKAGCRVWRVAGPTLPMARLRAEVPPFELKTYKGRDMREALAKLMNAKESRVYEAGFAAGRAARLGAPPVDENSI
ncbi:hypothetical protein ASD83_16220 [Devosia sp. Root685]|uniref:hypothetical protein n=1 Tax=Devosia sp. Root685 TaxID=1736587 RepID=UPI0007007158|nr:hypothetical protein [Devosia sp. Root685]KRA96639.1 hypothetical protein ASD83_16220 [Devosia sp. Root685]